jgi:hypothetical protein
MGESVIIILGLDLGTTAVKAVLLRVQASGGGEPELLASSTRVTEAYCVDPSGPFKREQDPLRILEAVRQALLGLPHALLASASACGLCDQMHGCLLWSAADPVGTATRLVTWEDGRCDPSFLASKNAALSSSSIGGASGPVFSGYGCATLAWLLEHEPGWFAGRDCAGTIGSWVTAVALLGPPPPPRVPLDPTDAASWGGCVDPLRGEWETGTAAAALHPALPAWLPPIVKPGTVVGRTAAAAPADSTSSSSPPPLLPLPASIPVHVCLGDHPASMVASLAWARARLLPAILPRNGDDDTKDEEGGASFPTQPSPSSSSSSVAVVSLGTSAQVAVAGDGVAAALLRPGTLGPLPDGCEVRPFVGGGGPAADPGPSSSCMLVGASLNGGNLLSRVVGLLEARVEVEGRRAGPARASAATTWTREDTYAYLEEHAASISRDALRASGLCIALPVPERRAVGWGKGEERTGIARLSPSSSDNAGDEGRGLPRSAESAASDEGLPPPLVYAAAAHAVVSNLFSLLPAGTVRGCGVLGVVCGGGAVAKSALLRRLLEEGAGALVGGGEAAGAGDARHLPVLFLPDGDGEFAGATGAALVAAGRAR